MVQTVRDATRFNVNEGNKFIWKNNDQGGEKHVAMSCHKYKRKKKT